MENIHLRNLVSRIRFCIVLNTWLSLMGYLKPVDIVLVSTLSTVIHKTIHLI